MLTKLSFRPKSEHWVLLLPFLFTIGIDFILLCVKIGVEADCGNDTKIILSLGKLSSSKACELRTI
jgi:hypothetical protein